VSDLKPDAATLQWAIAFGILPVARAVAWADALIATNRASEAPSTFEISLLREDNVAQAVALLSAVPGDAPLGTVGQRLASILRDGLGSRRLSVELVARTMYQMLDAGLSPDEKFEDAAHHVYDGVDLAQSGVWESLEQVEAAANHALSGYTAPPLALQPEAA
jgi:hypothetical protein